MAINFKRRKKKKFGKDKEKKSGGSSSVFQDLLNQAQESKKEQQGNFNYASWGDMENGQVLVACLDDYDVVEEEGWNKKKTKKFTFEKFVSRKVKIFNKLGKCIKILEPTEDEDGEEKLPTVPLTEFLKEKVEEAIEEGSTCVMLSDHEKVVTDDIPNGFHKVVRTFGDDSSSIRKALEE